MKKPSYSWNVYYSFKIRLDGKIIVDGTGSFIYTSELKYIDEERYDNYIIKHPTEYLAKEYGYETNQVKVVIININKLF